MVSIGTALTCGTGASFYGPSGGFWTNTADSATLPMTAPTFTIRELDFTARSAVPFTAAALDSATIGTYVDACVQKIETAVWSTLTNSTAGTFGFSAPVDGPVTYNTQQEATFTVNGTAATNFTLNFKTVRFDALTNTWVADATCYPQWAPKSPAERLREIIRSRLAPSFIGRERLGAPGDLREQCARETLRKIVGPTEFRRFLTRGFVLVRGRSGNVYQAWPGHGMTTVWRHGVALERLCVVLIGDFPPTDSLVMRCLLILNDESDFRSRANVLQAEHKTDLERGLRTALAANGVDLAPSHGRSLVEIYKSIKGNAV